MPEGKAGTRDDATSLESLPSPVRRSRFDIFARNMDLNRVQVDVGAVADPP